MIRVLNDHVGTRIGSADVDGARVSVRIHREPMTRADWTTHDYNVHFCVGLENLASYDVVADVSIEGGLWDHLPDQKPLLYASTSPAGPYAPAAFEARTDLRRRYAIRVPLPARGSLYIANTMVRCPQTLSAEFSELARKGGAKSFAIGATIEGRDILAHSYGRDRGGLLITSGFHPPEPDTLASAEIMRYLASPEGQKLVERIPVTIVPIANPDGYALGTQGANASGINFYWNFAREEPALCPEAAALWQLAETMAPRGYIDFHCYTFQLRKRAGPYLRPLLFYTSETVRAAARRLYESLIEDGRTKAVQGFGTYAPSTFGAMLATRFDTLALAKYHLHLAEGAQACGARGLEVFKALAAALTENHLVGGAPQQPAAGWRAPLRVGLVYWAGLLRPMLGRLRRGHFSRHQFKRMAVIVPGTDTADEVV